MGAILPYRPRKLSAPRSKFTVMLDPELVRRADALVLKRKAVSPGISRADIINSALEKYLDSNAE